MKEKKIIPIVEGYNVEEEYLYEKTYTFIKGFATGRKMTYTLKALPLARKFHNNQYRAGLIKDERGNMVKLPYLLHVLKVCSTLISLDLPLSNNELDTLCAASILHDCLEDGKKFFPKGGIELKEEYGFTEEIYEIIKILTKRQGCDAYEINEYFNNVKKNKFALLIKLADRSHNVEDLYNMKDIPKYIKETKEYFIDSKSSICAYGKQTYPELSNGITILKTKIVSLTETTEAMLVRNKQQVDALKRLVKNQKKEIDTLKAEAIKRGIPEYIDPLDENSEETLLFEKPKKNKKTKEKKPENNITYDNMQDNTQDSMQNNVKGIKREKDDDQEEPKQEEIKQDEQKQEEIKQDKQQNQEKEEQKNIKIISANEIEIGGKKIEPGGKINQFLDFGDYVVLRISEKNNGDTNNVSAFDKHGNKLWDIADIIETNDGYQFISKENENLQAKTKNDKTLLINPREKKIIAVHGIEPTKQ